MDEEKQTQKPKLTLIQGGNEREMRLIRALDKVAGFKDDPEADAAFKRASEVYRAEGEAARRKLTLVK